MKVNGWLVVLTVLSVVACGGEVPSQEPEPAEAPASEPTADELVTALDADCAAAEEAIQARQAESSLYDRLDGHDGIHSVVTEIIRLHRQNETIVHVMEGVDDTHLIDQVTDFLAQATGGDVTYEGRDMAEAHAHLELTNEHFLAAGGDVQTAMQTAGVGEDEIQEIMCLFASLRSEVVQL